MKKNRKCLLLIIALGVISAFLMVPCVAQTPILTDLGVLGTNSYNYAVGINDSGLIAGYSFDVVGYNYLSTAVVWQPGDTTPTTLPLLGSDPYSEVLRFMGGSPVNNLGLVVGASFHYDNSDNPVYQACMWQQVAGNWTVTGLGFLPNTEHDSSDPFAMNASGKVVGRSSKNGTEDWGGFIWDKDNGMQPFPSTSLPVGPLGTSDTLMPWGGISDNGYVAGKAMKDNTVNGGVIWDSETKTTIGYLERGSLEAISPSGLVAGYDYITEPSSPSSLNVFLFIWSYNNGTPVEQNLGRPSVTPPDGLLESDLVGMDIYPRTINNNGQIVGYGYAYWNGIEPTMLHWMWDGTKFIDLKTVLPTIPAISDIYPTLNAKGEVALTVEFEDKTYAAYLWNGNASDPAVALEGLGGESAVFNINDTGQLAGMSLSSNDSKFHACAWGLSTTPPPTSALTISDVTLTMRKGKTLTATVKISNTNDTVAYDVKVTSVSLGGVDTNSSLPLVYGSIKPGASKKCTLQFKNVPSGVQELTIRGTSSLGDFFSTEKVTVP
ncbi:MAG: hypothetical protein ACYC0V_16500 [Armatimonadota bacterium]